MNVKKKKNPVKIRFNQDFDEKIYIWNAMELRVDHRTKLNENNMAETFQSVAGFFFLKLLYHPEITLCIPIIDANALVASFDWWSFEKGEAYSVQRYMYVHLVVHIN